MKKLILLATLVGANFYHAQTQVIAHRGFWKTNPTTAENSIAALKNAQKLKVYGSEFDVRMTKDGVLVINHDEHINGVEIAAKDFKSLKKQKLSNGENLSTLEKYLKQGKKSEVKLILEIKPAKTPELETEMVEKTLAMVEKFHLQNQTEYISFSLHIAKELKKQNPKALVQYLAGDLSPQEIKNLGIDGVDYHYNVFLEKHQDWVEQAKNLGVITNVWTVNDIEIYKKLYDAGVQFVTTNTPDVFLNINKSRE
ncbi:glycerophosphodiester phosphodiesterase [Cloacibacterium normanense]|uniref:glycerophosphodiester phosphodiesterase n=1 Tax=Cloacibacterium normanense TaxID=237258 RepID=UPI00352F6245